MVQQKALFLETPVNGEFLVKEKAIPQPGPGQILVKVHATGLNPVEWKIRAFNFLVSKYPAILGLDAAGTVEAVGESVQAFAKEDRVVTQGNISDESSTYQQYILVPADLVAKIPLGLSFDEAASLPSGVVTATVGLYLDRQGGGQKYTAPWEAGGKEKYSRQAIVVNGGAGSVGQYVIQLAKLSGFSPIITTASAHNKEHLASLGATHVVDRSSGDTFSKIRKVLDQTPVRLIFDTVSTPDTQTQLWEILSSGGQLVLLNQAAVDKEKYKDKTTVDVVGISHFPVVRSLAAGLFSNLTRFLEDGSIKPNRVEVVPGGLAGIPEGLERLENNKVSGKKLVVRP